MWKDNLLWLLLRWAAFLVVLSLLKRSEKHSARRLIPRMTEGWFVDNVTANPGGTEVSEFEMPALTSGKPNWIEHAMRPDSENYQNNRPQHWCNGIVCEGIFFEEGR